MHQPLYRDPETGKFALPWARFHALSSYFGMARILEDFPGIRVTFNLVPVLLTQLEGYVNGETDRIQDLCLKAGEELEDFEVLLLTKYAFTPNQRTRIEPFPRYDSLHRKWLETAPAGHRSLRDVFDDDEIRDLQVWLSLCHFDEEVRRTDPEIADLISRGGMFSEDDKKVVRGKETELIARVLPLYRRLWDAGRIEVSTSPFYHPILPLLVDPQTGREANPGLPEYDLHFHWPEDAVSQVTAALNHMEDRLGSRPAGIWPSEGSLSPAVIELLHDLGVVWTATDEENLTKSDSTGPALRQTGGGRHFSPYRLGTLDTRIFFRDRFLSDRIGFTYQTWDETEAAQDLVSRLKRAAETSGDARVIPLILDGENPWEHYREGGRRFLRGFYGLLENEPALRAVTFSEACELPSGKITRLSPGSWINGNFDIWIGDEEDRRAWRLVEQTRNDMARVEGSLPQATRRRVEELIAAAQGSDWFWWFGKEHATADLDVFDRLFRHNLIQAYREAGMDVPEVMWQPVPEALIVSSLSGAGPLRPLHPRIDGDVTHHFEWMGAGVLDVGVSGSVMALASPLTSALFYGFDDRFFYLRLDTRKRALAMFKDGYSLDLEIRSPAAMLRLRAELSSDGSGCTLTGEGEIPTDTVLAAGEILECRIPLYPLTPAEGDSLMLQLTWSRPDGFEQRVPPHGEIRISVPSVQRVAEGWLV